MNQKNPIKLVVPHGGRLKPLLLGQPERKQRRLEAAEYRRIALSSKELSDLIMMASGAFSPLLGFMESQDYKSVVEGMCLAGGTTWPVPVTLAVSAEQAAEIRIGERVCLTDSREGNVLGTMEVRDKYEYDPRKEAACVFGTEDANHPGVGKLYEQDPVYLGGPVEAFSEGEYPSRFPEYARPEETRRLFAERKWSTVTAFQTRNPLHRSHEYLTKIAMEVSDGVFIHPIVGALKPGDIPAEVRMKCYQALLSHYYPKERVVLKVYPMEMRYAGPREAVLHAIIRQNFGCSHIIIGRDHAGVGSYYDPFDAQEIFDRLPADALEIKPLKLDWTFWCYTCGGMASLKTCPHDKSQHLLISGTQLRKMLAEGKRPPAEFIRPEVVEILLEYYAKREEE